MSCASAPLALVNISAKVTTMIETDFVFMVYPQGSGASRGPSGDWRQLASGPSLARVDRPGGLSYSEGTIAQGWMRSTRVAGCAAAAMAATITMTELSPRADADQGENPWSFDAIMSATGNAMASPRASPPAASLSPLDSTLPIIWRGDAPRASRMPNSLDRRAKSAAVMPCSPVIVRANARKPYP